MAQVLTTSTLVGCGHAPGRVGTSSSAKLTVEGAPVLVPDSIVGKTVSSCATQPSNTTKPCTAVASLESGTAGKLTAGGAPVVLSTLSGKTDGNPIGTLSASNVQSRLTAQ